jgi:hypothetical protein
MAAALLLSLRQAPDRPANIRPRPGR